MTAPATLRVIPNIDMIELGADLAAMLIAAPTNLRIVNTSDRFTFASGVSQVLDDGLADFDATDFLDMDGDDIETGHDLLEDEGF